jgi:hypothetical protein
MRLRLATWNIENGGLNGADDARMCRQMELLSLCVAVSKRG